MGHFISAKILGYQPTIHYNKITFENDGFFKLMKEGKISDNLNGKLQIHKVFWSSCGPLATLLLAMIGLVGLIIKNRKSNNFNNLSLFFLLLSINWLRNISVVLAVSISFIFGKHSICDEFAIETGLKLPPLSLFLTLGIFGLLIFILILLKFVPYKLRIIFLYSLFVGGTLGSILWLFFLGPIILP
jgi:hypothetical protein